MTLAMRGSPFPDASHDHEHCVTDALTAANRICKERGLRLTPRRRRVLELVWRSHRPIGAYDLLEQLGADGKRAAPPTVYRALEFLIDAGLVHRLDSLNAFIGCADPSHAHTGQFLICTQCRSVAELNDDSVESLVHARARDLGFEPESLVLELQGVCAGCRPD